MNQKLIAAFILTIVAVSGITYMIGYSTKPTAVSAQTPAPEAAVVTVTPEPVVVEKEVRVAEIPAVCFDALDRADEAFVFTGDVFGIVGELFQAISEFDVVGMERAGEKISEAREQLDPKLDAYTAARDACRANAKG